MVRHALFAAALCFAANAATAQSFQILPADQVQAIRTILPMGKIESGVVEDFDDIIRGPDMIWYTKQVMPPAYQIGFGIQGNVGPMSIGDVSKNISADVGEGEKLDGQGGNANIDFPWGTTPGGAMQAETAVRDVKGFYLPRVTDSQSREYGFRSGDRWPVALVAVAVADPFDTRFAGNDFEAGNQPKDTGLAWIFPVGTIFVEVLMMRDDEGRDVVFEIRARVRVKGEWQVDIFRPFDSPATLANAIEKRRPNYKDNPTLATYVEDLRNKFKTPKVRTLKDKHIDGVRAFERMAGLDVLPELGDDDLAFELLATTEFSSQLGQEWRRGVTVPTTTGDGLNIVPKNYHGAFVGNQQSDCMACHEHAGRFPARVFDPRRGWYGLVRGSKTEGILSWHPWEPAAYKGKPRADVGSGLSTQEAARRFGVVRRQGGGQADINLDIVRQDFLREGVVAIYDDRRYPVSVYHLGVPK